MRELQQHDPVAVLFTKERYGILLHHCEYLRPYPTSVARSRVAVEQALEHAGALEDSSLSRGEIEALKSDEIVNKLGGRFKLTALIQRRLRELIIDGARPLVERDGRTDLELVIAEVEKRGWWYRRSRPELGSKYIFVKDPDGYDIEILQAR